MGPHSAKVLVLSALIGASPVSALEAGWHYSPLPGEGDRASMGCARGSTETHYACLVVRCEDDFTVGLHVYSSSRDRVAGQWEITLDRETRQLTGIADDGPYGVRLVDPEGWLLDGLKHGTFVYLGVADSESAAFDFIDLNGSFRAIAEALYWCAPRVEAREPNDGPNVDRQNTIGEAQ